MPSRPLLAVRKGQLALTCLRETVRAQQSPAAPSLQEQGLKAVERNLALMVFLPKQIAASAEAPCPKKPRSGFPLGCRPCLLNWARTLPRMWQAKHPSVS